MSRLGRFFGKQDERSLDYSDEERKIFAASFRIGWTVMAFGVAGTIVVGVWAYGMAKHMAKHPLDFPGLSFAVFFGADLMVAAAAAAGALFGFVFGIPRTLDPVSHAAVATAASRADAPATAASRAVLAANTNLERISDWLTTLLIGATLVQIKDIAKWVGELGKDLVAPGPAANDAVVPIIVIYFFALSFLGVYLITRLYLTSAFQQTLGLLAGVERRGLDLGRLKQKLDAAARSGLPEDLEAAMIDYDNASLGAERADPDLNAKVARILAKQIAGNSPTNRAGDRKAELRNVVVKAAADPTIKAQLKSEMTSKQLSTGDAGLDAEIEGGL